MKEVTMTKRSLESRIRRIQERKQNLLSLRSFGHRISDEAIHACDLDIRSLKDLSRWTSLESYDENDDFSYEPKTVS